MGDAQNREQPRGRPFVSGDPRANRGGRPKGYNAFRKAFRGKDDVAAIRKRLMEHILGDDAGASNAAAKLWLEYGFGKTPSAPDDNEALRDSGTRLPDGLTAAQTLAIARGETP